MGSVAKSSETFDPSEPEKLVPYLRSLWSRRAYAMYVATSDLRDRQVTSALGNLWYLLNPALQILVYFIIFGLIVTGVRDGIDNYILFLTVGVLLFTTVQRSTITGSTSVVRNRGLIQSFNFPKALLPLTSCIAEFLASLPAVLVMFVVAVLTGERIAVQWLAIIPIIMSLFILNLGLGLLAARVTTYFRDFDQILPFVLRLLLYMSGVLFSVEQMLEGRSFRWAFEANPIHAHLSLARWSLMGGNLSTMWIVCAGIWGSLLLAAGITWFHAGEKNYGDV